jgi:hypothetical protein
VRTVSMAFDSGSAQVSHRGLFAEKRKISRLYTGFEDFPGREKSPSSK